MDHLPNEMLVQLLREYWEGCRLTDPHTFFALSFVCKRFSSFCRDILRSNVRELFKDRNESILCASKKWQRKCSKWPWMSKIPSPLHMQTIPLISDNRAVVSANAMPEALYCKLSKMGTPTTSRKNEFSPLPISTIEYVVFGCDVTHYQLVAGVNCVIAEGYNVKAGSHVPIWSKYAGFPMELLSYHECEMFCKLADDAVTSVDVTILAKWWPFTINERVEVASDPVTIVCITGGIIVQRMSNRCARAIKWYIENKNLAKVYMPKSFKRALYAIEDENETLEKLY